MAPLRSVLALAAAALALCACTISHRTNGEPSERPSDGGMREDASASRDAADRDADRGADERDAEMDAASEPDAAADARADVEPLPNPDEDSGVEAMVDIPCEQQIDEALDGLPDDLACTGLYADIERKIVVPAARWFVPGLTLWSDGAGKQRWVILPEGDKVDASDPNNWVFPVGTKFFKEFRVDGRRVETRLYQKARVDRWVRTTYAWNREETAARRSAGGDISEVRIAGADYHIPTGRECDRCHGGRRDRVLGFEAVALGLPDAQGVTLQDLVDEGLLDPPPLRTKLAIGDDGTGLAAPVLGYLHMNCGVCCHNSNQNADAYSSDLFMKLDVRELDGRPVDNFEPIRLLVDQTAKTLRWGDRKRVIAGDARQSLLYQLMSSRAGPREQMPPIATKVVDSTHVEAVRDWIEALPAN